MGFPHAKTAQTDRGGPLCGCACVLCELFCLYYATQSGGLQENFGRFGAQNRGFYLKQSAKNGKKRKI